MINIPEVVGPFIPPGIRMSPVIGDSMAPTLGPGDYVLAVPAAAYEGQGFYLMDGDDIFRVESNWKGGLALVKDNPHHTRQDVPLAWFAENVLARVVGRIQMM